MDNATAIPNSNFLSLAGYRLTDATTTAEAYDFTDGAPATDFIYNVALMLDRVEEPTEMLAGNWASRQNALTGSDLWTNYGANHDTYDNVVSQLEQAQLTIIDSRTPGNDGYYTSTYDNRTIWVQLTSADDFNTLFGNGATDQILQYSSDADLYYWDTDLSLPTDWGVVGLWFDYGYFRAPTSRLGSDPSEALPQGPQSPGNSGTTAPLKPQEIADRYHFPLDGQDVQTGTVGLIEPSIGTYLPGDSTGTGFQAALEDYLDTMGVSGSGQVSVQGLNGQNGAQDSIDAMEERSADVGVVASINPNSDIQLFSGSGGTFENAGGGVFAAVQASIWNPVGGLPAVTSSSWTDLAAPVPGSPYWVAYQQLYIDAALRNQTTVIAAMDGGSGGQIANGLTNVNSTQAQPYNILVGGTSISGQSTAMTDPTLVTAANAALQGDKDVLWRMMMHGLTTLPTESTNVGHLFETVWNTYSVTGDTIDGYTANSTGAGGVDVTQGVPPSYQAEYGLNPVSADSLGGSGRGVPDVSGNAGGNMGYWVPNGYMYTSDSPETYWYNGTSVAAPLWAALITQFNYIFNDQGLPNLGYMNDLLYIASAIAPGSFNDITVGRNNSTFYYDSSGRYLVDGWAASATDVGYSAGPGYDYVTGLGTPNGVLLGRALTTIAHTQTSFPNQAAVLDSDGTGGWTSGADQSLLFQAAASRSTDVDIDIAGGSYDFKSGTTHAHAWTAQLAQQVLQSDFDPSLVRLFDKEAQGRIVQETLSDGDSLSVSLGGNATSAPQATLTSDYGFASFTNGNGSVTVARAVAIADTAGAADNQLAVVRVRQNGQDNTGVTFYQVDDLAGTINGLQPGQAGYAAAAQGNAYQFFSGGTVLNGQGYGNYMQNLLMGVDHGDYIAMSLINYSSGQTYWAFSQANPDTQAHLWSYGLNTWGWEDVLGGGDHDFNDMIVQLDFTSASGSNLLV